MALPACVLGYGLLAKGNGPGTRSVRALAFDSLLQGISLTEGATDRGTVRRAEQPDKSVLVRHRNFLYYTCKG